MIDKALVASFVVFTVYGFTIPNQGERLERAPRCDECDDAHHRLPPPPPFFHAQQWSGLARNPDGSHQRVFSGATAAVNSGSQTTDEALSIASSSVNNPGSTGNNHASRDDFRKGQSSYNDHDGDKNFGQSDHADGLRHGTDIQQKQSLGFDAGQQVQSNDFGGASSQSQSSIDKSWDNANHGRNQVGHSTGLVGANGRDDLNNYRFESQSQHSYGGSFNARQQQSPQSRFETDAGQQQTYQSGYNKDRFSNGLQSTQPTDDSFRGHNQEAQRSNYNSDRWQNDHNGAYGNNKHIVQSREKSSSKVGAGHDEGQATLHGALDLASQGLQSAQQIQQDQPGCSTCSKSNYALSNAKSRSGNAVAVSIGG